MPAKPPATVLVFQFPVRSSVEVAAPGSFAVGPLAILRVASGWDKSDERNCQPDSRALSEYT
jgi:hypothetical protein